MGPAEANGLNQFTGARVIGVSSLVGAVLCTATYFVPGLLRPGTGWLWMAGIQIVTVVIGLLMIRGRQLRYVLLTVLLLGDLLWTAARWATTQPDSQVVTAFLCTSAIIAGLVFSKRVLTFKIVASFPVVALGLASSRQGSTLLGAAVSICLTTGFLSVMTYRARRYMEMRLDYVATLGTTDPLTGLATRRHMQSQVPQLLESAARRGEIIAAMVIDLDHFKRVNDEHGHAIGDQVLTEVAARLKGALPAKAILGRMGGEEFLVLTTATDAQALKRHAHGLHSCIEPMTLAVPVTCSVGVAAVRLPDAEANSVTSLHTLITRADDAMYRAKRAGRDRVEFSVLSMADLVAAPAPDALSVAVDTSQPATDEAVATCPGICELSKQQDRVSQTVATSRQTGWLSLLGFVAVSLNLLITGVTYGGQPRWYLIGTAVVMLVSAAALTWRPVQMARVLPLLIVLGPVWWVVIQLDALTSPLGQVSPLLVLLTVVMGAWLLSAKATIAVVVSAVFAFSAGMQELRWSFGQLLHFVVVSTMVTIATAVAVTWLRAQFDKAMKQAGLASISDAVTGLANRRHLLEHAEDFAKRSRHKQYVAVMVLDLDHFKKVNDTYGHAIGDEVLRQVGQALRACLAARGVVARVGGEEMIALAHVTSHEHARQVAEELRLAVAQSLTPAGMHITCSVGVVSRKSVPSGDTHWLWEMYENADRALYQAKEQGRNRVVMAQPMASPQEGHIPAVKPVAVPNP